MNEAKAMMYATIMAAFAAAIAAGASSIQAHVTWKGRNDVLKATLLTEGVRQCSVANVAMTNGVEEVAQMLHHVENDFSGTRPVLSYKPTNDVYSAVLTATTIFLALEPESKAAALLATKYKLSPHYDSQGTDKETVVASIKSYLDRLRTHQSEFALAYSNAVRTIAFG
jgi:hypothetical protein